MIPSSHEIVRTLLICLLQTTTVYAITLSPTITVWSVGLYSAVHLGNVLILQWYQAFTSHRNRYEGGTHDHLEGHHTGM
jgi:hypothetical protein